MNFLEKLDHYRRFAAGIHEYLRHPLPADLISLVRRQMRFGTLTTVELAAFTVGALAAVGLALVGAGYWALVGRAIAEALSLSLGFWLA